MTVASKNVEIADTYEIICDGMASASIRVRVGSQVRLFVGTAEPDDDVRTYFSLFNGTLPLQLAGLATADNVYARAEFGNAELEVIEGPAA